MPGMLSLFKKEYLWIRCGTSRAREFEVSNFRNVDSLMEIIKATFSSKLGCIPSEDIGLHRCNADGSIGAKISPGTVPSTLVFGNSDSTPLIILAHQAHLPAHRDPQIASLYKFAKQLNIELPEENKLSNCKSAAQREKHLMYIFSNELAKTCKVLVIKEAQRDPDLIAFLVKNDHRPTHFVISGISLYGQSTIDGSNDLRSQCKQIELSVLRIHEVLHLLNAILGKNISVKAWIDFWTVFNGEPSLYKELEKRVAEFDKSKAATDGLYDYNFINLCYDIQSNHKFAMTVNETSTKMGHQSVRTHLELKIEKLSRKTLGLGFVWVDISRSELLSLAHPRPCDVVWKDSSIDIKCDALATLRAFKFRRGLGSVELLQKMIGFHARNGDLIDVLGLDCGNMESSLLSYDKDTDIDLLLLERQKNGFELPAKPLKAYLFIVKSHSSFFLGDLGSDAKSKYQALSANLAEKYQVELCLTCENMDVKSEKSIIQYWKEGSIDCQFPIKVIHLQNLLFKAPRIRVKKTKKGFFVARELEKENLIAKSYSDCDLLLEGRHGVGMSTLLEEICNEKKDWRCIELNISSSMINE